MSAAPSTRGAGAGASSTRGQNLALVLGLLRRDGPCSRAALADRTGLTKATISALVGELSAAGLVTERPEPVQGPTGRPATLVEVVGRAVGALGLEIGVDYLACGMVDLAGRHHHERVVELDSRHAPASSVISRLASLARTVSDDATGRVLCGTTVAVPGLVRDGQVLVAPNLGWRDVGLAAALAERGLPGPVQLGNEANLAALGLAPGLRRQGITSFLTVSGGVGVGAGVVIDGEVFGGAHGFGGELGHFVVERGGRRCRCGNRGCLETVAGEEHLLRRAGLRTATGRPWLEVLADRARAGHPRVLEALAAVSEALALAVCAAVNVLDPQAVVLSGTFATLAPWLQPPIEAALAEQVLGHRWAPLPVLTSELGRGAAWVGAAELALERVVADPLAAMRVGA